MTSEGPGAARPGHVEFEYINPGALEYRASFAFKILAILNGFGVVLSLIPPNPPVSTLATVVFYAPSAVLVAIMVATALSLDAERPWAIAAARPIWVLIGLAGIGLLVLAVADGRLRIPFDTAIAAWVLIAKPNARPLPRPDRLALGAMAGSAALLGVMLSSNWLFRWGGVLDMKPSDLRATLSAACTNHVPGTPLPATIRLDYDWTWSTWRPLPSGVDVVVIGWDGNDGAGKVAYFTGTIPDPDDDGIHPGFRAYPSSAMAASVMAETRNHWVWGLKLEEQGYRPGHIDVTLELVNSVPGAEPLRIVATYIHEGVWRQDTATVTCSW